MNSKYINIIDDAQHPLIALTETIKTKEKNYKEGLQMADEQS